MIIDIICSTSFDNNAILCTTKITNNKRNKNKRYNWSDRRVVWLNELIESECVSDINEFYFYLLAALSEL